MGRPNCDLIVTADWTTIPTEGQYNEDDRGKSDLMLAQGRGLTRELYKKAVLSTGSFVTGGCPVVYALSEPTRGVGTSTTCVMF